MSELFKREHTAISGGTTEAVKEQREQKRAEIVQKFKEFFIKKGVPEDGFVEEDDFRKVPEITAYKDGEKVGFLGTKDIQGDVHVGDTPWGEDFADDLRKKGFGVPDLGSGWKIELE